MILKTFNVLVAVSGGIAAYKTPEIIRRLVTDHGAAVRVMVTSSACEFVKPLVFQAVSGNPVHGSLLDEQAEAGMGHIELARWADIILVAPATANTIAKMAHGMADDLVTTVCLASRARTMVAPAMNSAMWDHPATQTNLRLLRKRSVEILGPASGSQACGEIGQGRLLEPVDIVRAVVEGQVDSGASNDLMDSLSGVKVMITAGPTREAIDPVRFISNHSSGKMGFALASAAAAAGAEVTLVAGPVKLPTPDGVTRVNVTSAREMHTEVISCSQSVDIFIAVAAVADYRVEDIQINKIKKLNEDMTLSLTRNPDILADVASQTDKPFCVGFAAETQSLKKYAQGKLAKKNLDMIVANLVGEELGFNSDKNAVEVYWPDNGEASYPARTKESLGVDLIDLIATRFHSEH